MVLVPASDSEGIMLLSVTVIFTALAILSVGFRVWSRKILRTPLDSSDYFCFLALVQISPSKYRPRFVSVTDLAGSSSY